MVMGGGSCSKGREYIFHIPICCKNFNVCLKKTKINEKEAGVGPFLKKECGSGDGGQLTRNQLRRVRFEYRRGQFFVIVLLTKKLCEKKQLIDGSYLISIKYTYCSVKISAYLSLVFGQHTEDLYNYFSQSGPLQLALASS